MATSVPWPSLDALAAAGPLLIAVDDLLPYVDAASAAVLGFALRRLRDSADIHLFCTARAGEPSGPAVDALGASRVEQIEAGPVPIAVTFVAGPTPTVVGDIMLDMIDAAPQGETVRTFLRRGVVVAVVLLALAGLAFFLTSHSDNKTARDLCTTAAQRQFGARGEVTSVERPDSDSFIVSGAAGTRSFTCRVTREPMTDQWELASVS